MESGPSSRFVNLTKPAAVWLASGTDFNTVDAVSDSFTIFRNSHDKLTGRPGIWFVTRGPGATNASIGVHMTFQDSTPMILFIGQVGSDVVEREAFQEIDYCHIFGVCR